MNKVAMVLPFVLIAVAPFIGRWRANVWLKRNRQRELAQHVAVAETLAETA
jgi:drug/metabolite transporter superfamily protein YnfA